MNSLEFIEKEIEYYKQKKDKAVEWYAFLIEHNGSYTQIKRAEKERDAINNYLDNLQQIKTELEAWEVVKEEIEYNEEKACSERPDIVYSFEHWTFEINEDQGDFEEKSTKLKKALEVENEQRKEKENVKYEKSN